MTPTPAEPPRFADVSPRMAAPAPALPDGCLALLGSPPRAPLEGGPAFERSVGPGGGRTGEPTLAITFEPARDGETAIARELATGAERWRISLSRPADDSRDARPVALAPDGWAVAIGSSDGVTVRDGRDGRELVFLGTRERSITGMAFLPDGVRLAVAGSDLRVYDVTTGRQLAEEQLGHAAELAVDPTSGRIATISSEGFATLYGPSLARAATAWLFRFPRRLAFSSDGKHLVAHHLGDHVSLWQLDPPEVVSGLSGHPDAAVAVESSAGGLVSLGAGRICRWSGGRPSCLEGFERAALAPGGRAVAVAIGAGVWIYRGDTAKKVASVDERFGVRDVAFTRDGRWLLVLWGRSLDVHDAATGALVRTVPTGEHSVAGLHAVSGRHALFSRSSDSHLSVADLTGARPTVGPLDFAGHWSSAWSPDGKTALAADWKLRRVDRAGALLAEMTLDGEVRAGAWSPDGRWYAAGSDRAVAAYAASGNRPLWTSTAVVQPIAALDRGLLAARDREQVGTIVLLDARTGAERGRLVGGELAGTVEKLFPLPDRQLAAAAWEGRILLWKVP